MQLKFFLLLYADAIVLADTLLELQKKICVLEKFCYKLWGMEVDLTKTHVIVFRKGGKTSKFETFFYFAIKVNVVTYFRYLGLILQEITVNVDVAFIIFDSRILQILLYGSEIWGFESRSQIEKGHYVSVNLFLA